MNRRDDGTNRESRARVRASTDEGESEWEKERTKVVRKAFKISYPIMDVSIFMPARDPFLVSQTPCTRLKTSAHEHARMQAYTSTREYIHKSDAIGPLLRSCFLHLTPRIRTLRSLSSPSLPFASCPPIKSEGAKA